MTDSPATDDRLFDRLSTFFENLPVEPAPLSDITGARVLATTLWNSASRATSTVSSCRSPWSNGRRVHNTTL